MITNEMKANLPFDVKHLQNYHYKPNPSDKDCEGYDQLMKLWEDAEKDVLYSNVKVDWDSCDCGGEYGCSHGSFWTDITFPGQSDAIISEDNGRLDMDTKDAHISIGYNQMTMQGFEDCCKILGIELIPVQSSLAIPKQ